MNYLSNELKSIQNKLSPYIDIECVDKSQPTHLDNANLASEKAKKELSSLIAKSSIQTVEATNKKS